MLAFVKNIKLVKEHFDLVKIVKEHLTVDRAVVKALKKKSV